MKAHWTVRFAVAAAVAAVAGPLSAATWNGAGTGDNWSTTGNWSDSADPSGKAIVFDNTDTVGTQGTVNNIVDSSYTVSSLCYQQTANYHTTQINSGVTLTVTGGMLLGPTVAGIADVTIKGATPGVGSLAVTGGNFALANPVAWSTVTTNLDLSDLGVFTADVGNFDVNFTSPYMSGSLRLADSNTITADNLRMGQWGGGTSVANLYLGRGNTLNIDRIYVGGQNVYNGTQSYISFDSGRTNPTVTIRDQSGSGRVALVSVGDRPSVDNPSDKVYGGLDFSAGSVDALINELVVGSAGGRTNPGNAEEAYGYLTIGAGTVDATTFTLGRQTLAGTWNNGRGFLTLNGGTLIAGDMIIADQQVAPSTTSLAYGTANLNGGTLRATTMNGGGAHGGLVTFNFSSGVLASKAGTDLTVGAGVPLTLLTASAHTIDVEDGRTAAVNSAISGAAGTAGVTKTGEGTLLLNGANTYTGGTVVSAGTIGGTGSLASPVTVNAGADLAPGALVGTLTVAGDVDLEAGSDLIIEMDGGLIDLLAVSGLVDLSDATQRLMLYSPSARAAGAYTFLTAGSISGIFEEVYFNDILIPNPTAIGSIGGVLRLDYGDTALRLVPEPASAVLAALGLAALGHRRRRS